MKTFNLILLVLMMQVFAVEAQHLVNLTQAQKNEMTERHNYWRQQVGNDNLTWSEELAEYAGEWALHLAENGCNMQHRPRTGEWRQLYGENIFWGTGSYSPTDVVDSWASERHDYDGSALSYSNYQGIGHYTQVVWYNTTEVGCAEAVCGSGSKIWVCNYKPSGNYIGKKPYGNK